MRLSHVVNAPLSVQIFLTMKITWMNKILLHQTHQKTRFPLSKFKHYAWRPGRERLEKDIRQATSLIHNATKMDVETEIVNIGRKSHNECAMVITISNRSQKVLWDLGAVRCVISFDWNNSLHNIYKTELFPSKIRIKALNGTFTNKGECDITLKINDEKFTFPFLCSNQLSQQMIIGHNFSISIPHWHILEWRWHNVFYKQWQTFCWSFAHNVNALVFCAESTVIPPYSNGHVKCKMS